MTAPSTAVERLALVSPPPVGYKKIGESLGRSENLIVVPPPVGARTDEALQQAVTQSAREIRRLEKALAARDAQIAHVLALCDSLECLHCGGQGWYEGTSSEHDPRCMGECLYCPVPVPIQVQCDCQPEARMAQQVRALLTEAATGRAKP